MGASHGGSKTYTTCQIITDYEDNVMKSSQGTHKVLTISISLTIDANSSMFNNLKSLDPNDMYSEYKGDTLKDIIKGIKSIIDEVDEYEEYEKAYYVVDTTCKNKIKDLLKYCQSYLMYSKNITLSPLKWWQRILDTQRNSSHFLL